MVLFSEDDVSFLGEVTIARRQTQPVHTGKLVRCVFIPGNGLVHPFAEHRKIRNGSPMASFPSQEYASGAVRHVISTSTGVFLGEWIVHNPSEPQ